MENDMLLTHEAIWYYSLGFKQPSLLQVLSTRKISDNSLWMIVYDGLVCAGAKYDYSSLLQKEKNENKLQNMDTVGFCQGQASSSLPMLPQEYDVIRVQAKYDGKNEPLIILSLKIILRDQRSILGQCPITLQEYIKLKYRPTVDFDKEWDVGQLGKPTKHIKQNEETIEKVPKPSLITLSPPQYPKQTNIQNTNNKNFEESLPNAAKVTEKRSEQVSQEDERKRVKLQNSTIKLQEKVNGFWQMVCPFQQNAMIPEPPQPNQQKEKVRNYEQNKPINSNQQKASNNQHFILQKMPSPQNQLPKELPRQTQEYKPPIKINDGSSAKDTVNLADWKKTERSNHHKRQRAQIEDHILIQELVERMSTFKIICTVNYLKRFKYQEVNEGISMMLIDEVGDEIKCVVFSRPPELPKHEIPKLEVGRTYIFDKGEVELEDGVLNLKLAWDGFRETKTVVQSFNPNKMYRVGEIQQLNSSPTPNSVNGRRGKQLNVCGIFTGFLKQPCLYRKDKNNYLLVGSLCDPLHQKQINFSLFIDDPSSFPNQPGAVLTLHNMELKKQQGIYRLYTTSVRSSQSYFLLQTDSKHEYLSNLVEMSKKQQWKQKKYTNFYAKRTFADTKQAISGLLVGEKVFFEIECQVSNIFAGNEYTACVKCSRKVKPFDRVYAHCDFCTKNERWTTRIVFRAKATDRTEFIDFSFNSSILQSFVDISVEDYYTLSKAEKNEVLSKKSNQTMVLRGKSERTAKGRKTYVNFADYIF